MNITGAILIGRDSRSARATFAAVDANTGERLEPGFSESDATHVAEACRLADVAFPLFGELAPSARARFLETLAEHIGALGDTLIERAMSETGLARARLESERARTIGQLALFAQVVREGACLDVTIDHAMPNRLPLPRPDLRRVNVPIGPVAVFGASNFPLAFSVAGGDTVSAFAAGCPVVVKGHPAHPGTGELVALAIRDSVLECGLPEGVFSYLPGTAHALGSALVADPRIKGVGFTGSRAGGLALVRIAAARVEPIPVFAEMSSINPVVLFPGAARNRGRELGRAYVASLTLGAGQFCTNPGVLIAMAGADADAFIGEAASVLAVTPPQTMLTPGIQAGFEKGVEALSHHPAVTTVARGLAGDVAKRARSALFLSDAEAFGQHPLLAQEVFGASSIIVRAKGPEEIAHILDRLEGQLTATLLFDREDEAQVARFLPQLTRKVGRILANGWPTGVEVCHAMVHGGPFPACSDSRTTSVGALAIQRFLRPVCYQNLPDQLLPEALRENNPHRVARRIDGKATPP